MESADFLLDFLDGGLLVLLQDRLLEARDLVLEEGSKLLKDSHSVCAENCHIEHIVGYKN